MQAKKEIVETTMNIRSGSALSLEPKKQKRADGGGISKVEGKGRGRALKKNHYLKHNYAITQLIGLLNFVYVSSTFVKFHVMNMV